MKYVRTERFKKAAAKLPGEIQAKADVLILTYSEPEAVPVYATADA